MSKTIGKFEVVAALGNLELPDRCNKISFIDFTLRKCPNHSLPQPVYADNGIDIIDVDWMDPQNPNPNFPICEYYLETHITAQIGQGWQQAELVLAWALTRLRLFQKGDLWGSLYRVYDKNHPGITRGFPDIMERFKRRPKEPPSTDGLLAGRHIYAIRKGDIRRLRAFEKKMSGFSTATFSIPIRRFNQSFDRDFVDDRAIDLFIALESLLSEGPEAIAFKIALRAAGLIGKSPSEKLQVYSFLRKAYNKRSNLVHGGRSAIKWLNDKSYTGNTNLYELENMTRRVLRMILEEARKGAPLKGSDLDKHLFLR